MKDTKGLTIPIKSRQASSDAMIWQRNDKVTTKAMWEQNTIDRSFVLIFKLQKWPQWTFDRSSSMELEMFWQQPVSITLVALWGEIKTQKKGKEEGVIDVKGEREEMGRDGGRF